jgi:hypothetical protein
VTLIVTLVGSGLTRCFANSFDLCALMTNHVQTCSVDYWPALLQLQRNLISTAPWERLSLATAARVLEYMQQKHGKVLPMTLEAILAAVAAPAVSWGRGSTPPEILEALQQTLSPRQPAPSPSPSPPSSAHAQ